MSGAWIHVTLGTPAASTVIHGVWLRRSDPEMPLPVLEPVPTSVQRPTRASQPSTKIEESAAPPPAHAAIGPLTPGASERSKATELMASSPVAEPRPAHAVPFQRRTYTRRKPSASLVSPQPSTGARSRPMIMYGRFMRLMKASTDQPPSLLMPPGPPRPAPAAVAGTAGPIGTHAVPFQVTA